MRRLSPALLIVSLLVVALAAPAGATAATPGAPSAGDPYFPRQGNGGYDVQDYRLDLTYQPSGRRLSGIERVTARTTQALSRFDLDLRTNMVVSALSVNGTPATFAQPPAAKQELVITPAEPLADGATFTVDLSYAGRVVPIIDPDGSLDGFIPTDDGAFVANEPQGSPSWYAVNDTPTDKATFHTSVTVPNGLSAIGNGQFLGITQNDGTRTWHWMMGRPISSYLATATIGRFDLTFGTTPSGLSYVNAVDPRESAASAENLAKIPAMLDFLTSILGPYPWGTTGVIVDTAPNIGYALETATRPLFPGAPGELTLLHELAHQWVGDYVTLTRWKSIWLNEGFAEFCSWLYDGYTGGTSAKQHLADLLSEPASSGIWNPPPGNPGSGGEIFAGSVYDRGAGTLEALREKLGDKIFFPILRNWVYGGHAPYRNATLNQFTQYAARQSGVDLTDFFQTWLYDEGKPGTSGQAAQRSTAATSRR